MDFSKELGEVELLITEIQRIKTKNKEIFDEVKQRQIKIGRIFRENPQVKSIYRFQKLMETIEASSHFGHYARAISRAEWIGRIKKATPEEMETIVNCFRSKTRLPFLTIGFRRIWYVPSNPENKADQAMVLALKALYYKAKKEREEEDLLNS